MKSIKAFTRFNGRTLYIPFINILLTRCVLADKVKLLLRVNDELWEKFKGSVPRNVHLNDAVVRLIEEAVKMVEED